MIPVDGLERGHDGEGAEHATTRDLDEPAPVATPSMADAPRIGDRIDGQYYIRGVLGSGGMGTVYLAHDEHLDREVAIKFVHTVVSGRERGFRGFLAEARAMARVRHPNVAMIHAFGSRRGHPYFAMEYVRGENLSVWCRRHPLLAPVDALAVFDGLAQGVGAIHDTGTVHHDLKPSNVLMGANRRVVVTDFGLARSLGWELTEEQTPLHGTPAHVAPEVARREALVPELLTRIDVYALGVIAFEMLTGELPFRALSLADLLDQHAHAAPPRPTQVRPELPAAFEEPLRQALAKSPADRHASADDLRRALRRALGTTVVPTGAPTLRILVVDDEPNTLVAIRELLMMSMPGVEVMTADDGESGLAIAQHEPPDIVITDLNMPHGGGAVLTSALRADPATADVPIVVVTAYGGAWDWKMLRNMGADRFLIKPIEIDSLIDAIRTLTGRET